MDLQRAGANPQHASFSHQSVDNVVQTFQTQEDELVAMLQLLKSAQRDRDHLRDQIASIGQKLEDHRSNIDAVIAAKVEARMENYKKSLQTSIAAMVEERVDHILSHSMQGASIVPQTLAPPAHRAESSAMSRAQPSTAVSPTTRTQLDENISGDFSDLHITETGQALDDQSH